MKYQRGRRDLAGILHPATRIDNRLSAGAHDAIGARTQVAGDNHRAARTNIAGAQKIPKRSFDVDVGFEIGNVFDQATESAGAKRKGMRGKRETWTWFDDESGTDF